MIVKIEFSTANEAFDSPAEIGRILEKVDDFLMDAELRLSPNASRNASPTDALEYKLMDSNGNTVGKVRAELDI